MYDTVAKCDVTELKPGLLTRHFRPIRKSVVCGKEELPLLWSLGFFTFKTFYMHKNIYNTLKEREKKTEKAQ